MDRREIQDRQLIERYLQGKLAADEEQRFEERYISDPELLAEVVLTEKLGQGLEQVEQGLEQVENERGRQGEPRRLPARMIGLFQTPVYAAAASVVAAGCLILTGVLLVQNMGLRESAGLAGTVSTTRVVPLVSVRGDGANTVAAPRADEWTVFMIDAGFTEFDEYRATLTRRGAGSGEPVRQLEGLSPTYDGMIAVGLPGRLISPGAYEVTLDARMREWPEERGFERVTRTPLNVTARD